MNYAKKEFGRNWTIFLHSIYFVHVILRTLRSERGLFLTENLDAFSQREHGDCQLHLYLYIKNIYLKKSKPLTDLVFLQSRIKNLYITFFMIFVPIGNPGALCVHKFKDKYLGKIKSKNKHTLKHLFQQY